MSSAGHNYTWGVSEDEWVLLMTTLGRIKGIQKLSLNNVSGSREFHPFQAIANAVNHARSLHTLVVTKGNETSSRDPSGMIALANALREHTTLEDY